MAQRPKPTALAYVASVIAALIAVGAGFVLLTSLTPIYFLSPNDPEDRAPLIAILLVLALAAFLVFRTTLRIAARVFIVRGKRFEVPAALIVPCLADSDFPCPRCAYNLRGLTTPACPECNEPVRLAMIDYKARNPGEGFGLVLTWLLISTVCSLLISAYGIKAVFQVYSMMASMGGGGFGPGMGSTYLIWYLLYAIVPAASFVVCSVRLVALFFAKSDKAAGWSRSTVLALSITTVCWTLLFAVIAAIGLLQ